MNILFLLSIICYPAKAEQQLTFTIAAPDSPPFIYNDEHGNHQGLWVELFKLLEKEHHIKVSFQILPWARALQEVKIGRIDALIPAIFNKERSQYLAYPEQSLIEFLGNVLLKRKGDPFKFKSIDQISRKKVIVRVRSMSLRSEFDSAFKKGQLNVIDVLDTDTAILMLHQGKVDLMLSNYYVAISALKRIGVENNIEIVKISNEVKPSYIVFSRKFSEKNDINALMKIISDIRDSKTYQVIKQKIIPDYHL